MDWRDFPRSRRRLTEDPAEGGKAMSALRLTPDEMLSVLQFRRTAGASQVSASHPSGPPPAGMQAYQVSRPVGPPFLGVKHMFNVIAPAPGAPPYARYSSGPSSVIGGKLVDHPNRDTKTGRDDETAWLKTGKSTAAAKAGISIRPIDAPSTRVAAEGRALADRLGVSDHPGRTDYDLIPMSAATAAKAGLLAFGALGPVAGSLALGLATSQTDGANSNSAAYAGARRAASSSAPPRLPPGTRAPGWGSDKRLSR
jgi:hypothetical protein